MGGWVRGWMGACIYGCMGGWVRGWMGAWVDERERERERERETVVCVHGWVDARSAGGGRVCECAQPRTYGVRAHGLRAWCTHTRMEYAHLSAPVRVHTGLRVHTPPVRVRACVYPAVCAHVYHTPVRYAMAVYIYIERERVRERERECVCVC